MVFGYGISFDVEHLSYAVLDRDRTPASRAYLENYSSSRYFKEQAPLASHDELEYRLRGGKLKVAIEIPPDFGADLGANREPEIGVWLDGAMPTHAETSLGYVEGVHQTFLDDYYRDHPELKPPKLPAKVPVSSLSGDARKIGMIFPSSYFQHISMGSMTKSLGIADLAVDLAALALAAAVLILMARAPLRTQAR